MKKWVTTSWMYQTFNYIAESKDNGSNRWKDGISSRTWYTPDYKGLESALNKLSDYCNRHQMAVKSLVPLTSAQTFEYGQAVEYSSIMHGVVAAAGIGNSWGFSNVIGFAALLERIEEVSDEEYERRCGEAVSEGNSPSLAPA